MRDHKLCLERAFTTCPKHTLYKIFNAVMAGQLIYNIIYLIYLILSNIIIYLNEYFEGGYCPGRELRKGVAQLALIT